MRAADLFSYISASHFHRLFVAILFLLRSTSLKHDCFRLSESSGCNIDAQQLHRGEKFIGFTGNAHFHLAAEVAHERLVTVNASACATASFPLQNHPKDQAAPSARS